VREAFLLGPTPSPVAPPTDYFSPYVRLPREALPFNV